MMTENRIARVLTLIAATVLMLGMAETSRADLVIADFNDLNVAKLQGQAGGTGLSGTWYGSSGPQVVAGDLAYAR